MSIQLDPTNPRAWFMKGRLELMHPNFDAAKQSLQKYKELSNNKRADGYLTMIDRLQRTDNLVLPEGLAMNIANESAKELKMDKLEKVSSLKKAKGRSSSLRKHRFETYAEALAKCDDSIAAAHFYSRLGKRGKALEMQAREIRRGMKRQNVKLADINIQQMDDKYLQVEVSTHKNLKDLSVLNGLPVNKLNLSNCEVTDFGQLQNLPLEHLTLFNVQTGNLRALAKLPLKTLQIHNPKVADINALKGMKLVALDISKTSVSDLTPLKGMPLKALVLVGTKVNTLKPIAGMTLTEIDFRGSPVTDLTPLKTMTALKKINGLAPAEFWKKNLK